MAKDPEIKMDDWERAAHDSILKFGWSEWKARWQMGSHAFNALMSKLNPFAKAYFGLLERYYTATRLLEEARTERDHYKQRYMEIATQASESMRAFAGSGVTRNSIEGWKK